MKNITIFLVLIIALLGACSSNSSNQTDTSNSRQSTDEPALAEENKYYDYRKKRK